MLENWGIRMEADILRLKGRIMGDEAVAFANAKVNVGPQGDFNRELTNNKVMEAVDLKKWLVICTKRDGPTASKFIDLVMRNSRPMGIQSVKPDLIELPTDTVDTYVNALRKSINKDLQIVILICPTARDDRYAAIKRICCSEMPVPSQVINARTLANDQKARSIVQKIMLQMNCKLGGTLWSIKIPFKNVMIIGLDAYHEKSGGKVGAVVGLVASINSEYTKWFSRAMIQGKNEELANSLQIATTQALDTYQKVNNELPSRIIIYRDGVGDGQLQFVKDYEIESMKKAFPKGYSPEFLFIVVQKRVNTRLFAEVISKGQFDNPVPGTVVDHTITRPNMYDFYLIPQSVRQGTVTPTHYVVLEDTAGLSVDIVQRLSYKLCYLYYNWPGSVRVPACCQYAHKLADLVGQHIKRAPADVLCDKLYFL